MPRRAEFAPDYSAAREAAYYASLNAPQAAAPAVPPAPAPAPAYVPPAVTLGGAPTPEPNKPAMQGLMDVASGEKFRQEINPEGWDVEQPPNLAVPGQRELPPAATALAQLVQRQGRVY